LDEGHFCLGSHSARLEIRLMFETLLPRIKHIELAGNVAGCAATS
jgi:cytochrome P450